MQRRIPYARSAGCFIDGAPAPLYHRATGGRMTEAPVSQVVPLAVAQIERRIQWRVMPVLKFGAILGVLLGVAVWPTFVPPPRSHGLPADPDLEEAARELDGCVEFPSAGLRFVSAITGPVASNPASDLDPRLASAGVLVD